MKAGEMEERPVYFPAGDETLFGMYTLPSAPANGRTMVVLRGGGYSVISAYRHPFWAELAGRVAELGYSSFRFDYHGSGDSTGRGQGWRLDRSFDDDLRAALSFVRGLGTEKVLLAAQCMGARTALACAPHIEGLVGLAMVAPPVGEAVRFEGPSLPSQATTSQLLRTGGLRQRLRVDTRLWKVRGLWRAARRRLRRRLVEGNAGASRGFLEPLEALVQKGVPVFLMYGTLDGLDEFEKAKSGRLGRILESAGRSVEVTVLPGRLHGRSDQITQGAVLDALWDWIGRLPADDPRDVAAG